MEAYLGAYRRREDPATQLAQERSRLLTLYAQAYRDAVAGAASADYDLKLRLLWDLCGIAHATAISPKDIKEALGWGEPAPHGLRLGARPVALAEARERPLRIALVHLPERVLQLLQGTPMAAPAQSTFADFASAHVREVYLTPQLTEWSPNCPLDVCGSCEPLTRTLILVSASYVDLSPKPDWSLAAVAVHECAHVEWFHRAEVSERPRLLLPVPNERHAWVMTAMFLRGMLRSAPSPLRPYVRTHGPAIRQMLQQARREIGKANRILRLPEHDESLHLDLPTGITDEELRGGPAPVQSVELQSTGHTP